MKKLQTPGFENSAGRGPDGEPEFKGNVRYGREEYNILFKDGYV